MAAGAGYLQPNIAGYGHHPMLPGYPMMRGPLGPIPQQHHFSHLPYGAAAAATAISASALPKSMGQIRSTTIQTTAKIPGMPPHLPAQTPSLSSQTHVSASVTTTSRPSSPTVPLTNSTAPFHHQSAEYKQAESRDRGSPHVADMTRKTNSPHCSSPTVPISAPLLTNTKPAIPLPAVPGHKATQPLMLPHFTTQGNNPLGHPPCAVAVCISQSQPKPAVSVASIAKMYPSHVSLVTGRPGIGQTEGPAVSISYVIFKK